MMMYTWKWKPLARVTCVYLGSEEDNNIEFLFSTMTRFRLSQNKCDTSMLVFWDQ